MFGLRFRATLSAPPGDWREFEFAAMTTVIQEDFRGVFTENPVAGFLKDGAGTPPVKLARNIRTGLDQWDTKLVKQRTLLPGATFHVRVSRLNPESHVRTPLECQLSGRLELREMS